MGLCQTCYCLKQHDIIKAGQGKLFLISEKVKSFNFVKCIQRGSISDVWIIKDKKCKQYALKVTKKFKLTNKKVLNMILNQKKIMQNIESLFLANLVTSFQDRQHLYLLIEYMPNGNLRKYLQMRKTLPEKQASTFKNYLEFVIISILIALQYLHLNGIIHMDIKPQNILIDSSFYFRLCDLGLSKIYQKQQKQEITGTFGYQAPQLFLNDSPKKRNTNFMIDYYSLGVVCYELLTGFNNCTQKNFTYDRISQNLQYKGDISINCIDFVLKLLQENPKQRLGSEGFEQIWAHPWINLRQKQLNQYKEKKIQSLISKIPINTSSHFPSKYSLKTKNSYGHDSTQFDQMYYNLLVKTPGFQKKFRDYQTNVSRISFFIDK